MLDRTYAYSLLHLYLFHVFLVSSLRLLPVPPRHSLPRHSLPPLTMTAPNGVPPGSACPPSVDLVPDTGVPPGAVRVKSMILRYSATDSQSTTGGGSSSSSNTTLLLVLPLQSKIDMPSVITYLEESSGSLEIHSIGLAPREHAEAVSACIMGTVHPFASTFTAPIRTILDSALYALEGGGEDTESHYFFGGCGVPGYSSRFTLSQVTGQYSSVCKIDVVAISKLKKQRSKSLLLSSSKNKPPPPPPPQVQAMTTTGSVHHAESIHLRIDMDSFPAQLRRFSKGSSPLDLERFEQLLSFFDKSRSLDIDASSSSGKTALQLSAWRGPAQSVESLLARGADLNKVSTGPGNYGKSAIFYAMTRCRDDMVALLLSKGAHVKLVNNKGQTPRSLAASHLLPETLALVMEAEDYQRDLPWQNYYQSHREEGLFGDLDPRFVAASSDNSDSVNSLVMNPTTPQSRSVNDVDLFSGSSSSSSQQTRRKSHRNSNTNIDLSALPWPSTDSLLHPIDDLCVDGQSGLCVLPQPDSTTNLLELHGVVISKRHIGKALMFINLAPHIPNHSAYGEACYSQEQDKKLWLLNSHSDGVALQLIAGKTLSRHLGEETARQLCVRLKPNSVVRVLGSYRDFDRLAGIDEVVPRSLSSVPDKREYNSQYEGTVDIIVHALQVIAPPPLPPGDVTKVKEGRDRVNRVDGDNADDGDGDDEDDKYTYSDDADADADADDDDKGGGEVVRDQRRNLPGMRKRGKFLALSSDDVGSCLVDDELSALKAVAAIRLFRRENGEKESSHRPLLLAIDCEWQPASTGKRDDNPVALLQLAFGTEGGAHIDDVIFVIDIQTLLRKRRGREGVDESADGFDQLCKTLGELFECAHITKLGWGVESDLQRLAATFLPRGVTSLSTTYNSVLDLQEPALTGSGKLVSLSSVVTRLLGRPLDKTLQASQWAQRPLSTAQLQYAALDAAVLLRVYRAMKRPPLPNMRRHLHNWCFGLSSSVTPSMQKHKSVIGVSIEFSKEVRR